MHSNHVEEIAAQSLWWTFLLIAGALFHGCGVYSGLVFLLMVIQFDLDYLIPASCFLPFRFSPSSEMS